MITVWLKQLVSLLQTRAFKAIFFPSWLRVCSRTTTGGGGVEDKGGGKNGEDGDGNGKELDTVGVYVVSVGE